MMLQLAFEPKTYQLSNNALTTDHNDNYDTTSLKMRTKTYINTNLLVDAH